LVLEVKETRNFWLRKMQHLANNILGKNWNVKFLISFHYDACICLDGLRKITNIQGRRSVPKKKYHLNVSMSQWVSICAVPCLTDKLVYCKCDPIFFPAIDNNSNVMEHKVSSSRAAESYTHCAGSIAWWNFETPAAKKLVQVAWRVRGETAGQATVREMLTRRELIDREPSTQRHAVHYLTI